MNHSANKSSFPFLKLILWLVVIDLLLFAGMRLSSGGQAGPLALAQAAATVPPTLEASATSPAATGTPVPTLTTQPTQPLGPLAGAFIEQSKTVSGIEVQMSNVRRDEKYLKADICFPMPDNEDWAIDQIVFRYDGKEIAHNWGGSVIDPIIPAANGKPGRRCDTIYLDLPREVSLSEFTISVEALSAQPREGGICKRAKLLQAKLAAQGITVSCEDSENFGGYQVTAKPDSMSQEEAQKLAMKMLNLTIDGPWAFEVKLK